MLVVLRGLSDSLEPQRDSHTFLVTDALLDLIQVVVLACQVSIDLILDDDDVQKLHRGLMNGCIRMTCMRCDADANG